MHHISAEIAHVNAAHVVNIVVFLFQPRKAHRVGYLAFGEICRCRAALSAAVQRPQLALVLRTVKLLGVCVCFRVAGAAFRRGGESFYQEPIARLGRQSQAGIL